MGSYTNPRALKLRTSSITLSKGRSKTVKATVLKVRSGKKLLNHVNKLRFISSEPRVATVTANGKVTAKSKGKCKIYVLAVNGVRKAVKVTVK